MKYLGRILAVGAAASSLMLAACSGSGTMPVSPGASKLAGSARLPQMGPIQCVGPHTRLGGDGCDDLYVIDAGGAGYYDENNLEEFVDFYAPHGANPSTFLFYSDQCVLTQGGGTAFDYYFTSIAGGGVVSNPAPVNLTNAAGFTYASDSTVALSVSGLIPVPSSCTDTPPPVGGVGPPSAPPAPPVYTPMPIPTPSFPSDPLPTPVAW